MAREMIYGQTIRTVSLASTFVSHAFALPSPNDTDLIVGFNGMVRKHLVEANGWLNNLYMSDKFQNKYRIPSARLQSYDYGRAGMYFVTICTKNRMHFFGEIENGIMDFSALGKIVAAEWVKTPAIRPDMNLELGAFVVMPNHFHAILIIGDNAYNTKMIRGTDDMHGARRDAMHGVSTAFKPQSKNLASIIRGFKSSVTTYARNNNIPFDWQPRFHDHIIRTGAAYDRISRYIMTNPINWKKDTFNKIK